VAKRVRSNRGAYRPGGQGPARSKETDDGTAQGTDTATDLDADELIDGVAYSEVEVDEVAAAAVAAATATRPASAEAPTRTSATRTSARAPRRERHRPKGRSDELAARADAESTWVREDLLRIGWVSLILIVALAVSWVLFGFLDVLDLY